MPSPFRHRHRVGYSECTIGNHVYYARYLDMLESARGEFFRSLGTTFAGWQERDVIFPVVEAHVKYRAAARYDDELEVKVWATEIARVRIGFGYRIAKAGGALLVEATTVHVCTGVAGRPCRVPEELAARLRSFLHAESRVGAS